MFGGVHDVEENEEGIESEFFDQLYAWNIERNRFFPLVLRRARAAPKKHIDDRGKRGRGKADEAELLRNLAALETKGTLEESEAMDTDLMPEEDMSTKVSKPILNVMPHARFNAQLAVQGDVLYIYGGTYEQGDREYTFDEMYAVDLGKLDGVEEIYRRELENWQGDGASSESESEEDDDDSEDEDMEGNGPSGVILSPSEIETGPKMPTELPEAMEEDEQPEPTFTDNKPHPRPFESLRDFFTRTSHSWQELVLKELQSVDGNLQKSIKELRKVAFELSETKWWDCREEIIAEEERQEEAGIGEVVDVGERATEGGGAHRRR